MTKFQFFLISAIASSILFLVLGSRDSNSLVPIAIMVALATLANRFIPAIIWEKFASTTNSVTGKKIFRVRKRTRPSSKPQSLLPPARSPRL